MTTNNHPAHGPVSLDRLHQISEILSKAAAQSDGGNLGYAMADAVKVIDVAIAAFGAEPVEFLPDNLDRELTILGVDLPISKEEFNLDAERWMQRLINRVIRLESELIPPAPVVPDDQADAFIAAIEKEQDRLHEEDYLMDSKDCIDVIREEVQRLNACRAAMLQDGNYPVTPDGWIPVSERVPPQGVPLLVCSGNGVVQRTVYGFDGENWLDWYEQYDPVKAKLDDLWQPLPAPPQQEVKNG